MSAVTWKRRLHTHCLDSYLSFREALGYCRKISADLSVCPKARRYFPVCFRDAISAAWTLGRDSGTPSEKASSERTRRSGSISVLSLILARLRTSKEVSVSLASSSSSLESRCSGVCLLRLRDGVSDRPFEKRASAPVETDRFFWAGIFLPFSESGEFREGVRVGTCKDDERDGAALACTTLRI